MLNKMKWQAPGIAFIGGGGSSGGSSNDTTQTYTSSLEQLAGQTFPTQEALDAAEAQVQTDITQGQVDQVQQNVDAVASDPTTAVRSGQENVANIEAQIAQLTTQLAENPDLQTRIDELTQQLNTERTNLVQAGNLAGQQQAYTQQDMVNAAMTDPQSLIDQAQVSTTTVTPDQLIAAGTGQAGEAAQGTATTVQETATAQTPARQEASTYDAATVNDQVQEVTGDMQAAVAEPSSKATVRGQLESLMADFEGGETPPWASGPMRQAMQMMQSRGMGASSMAGAAVVQAAMESAISIASQDANTSAQFEMQNLNNTQQTMIFKTQQRLAGLFSDQAAQNASAQFNASSENQTNQFFSNLEATASQFNANQINAIRQFNAGETNQLEQFNTQMRNARDQFNAQNSLIISQANAQWRQNVATTATAAQNVANLEYTRNANAITGAALDQIWQRERDLMDYAFQSSESAMDRANAIILQNLSDDSRSDALKLQADIEDDRAFGAFVGETLTSILGI